MEPTQPQNKKNLAQTIAEIGIPSSLAREPNVQHLSDYAETRYVAPLGTLLCALTWISAAAHRHVIDIGIGGKKEHASPLNLYLLIVGNSSAGKTQINAVTQTLLDVKHGDNNHAHINDNLKIDQANLPLGTGQGVLEAYFETCNQKRQRKHETALFHSDEWQAVHKQTRNETDTLLERLRTLWSGANVGTTNADPNKKRNLKAGSYTLGIIAGSQPNTAQNILNDMANGDSQRWIATTAHYLPHHNQIPRHTPLKIEGWPTPNEPTPIKYASQIVDEVIEHRIRNVSGQPHPDEYYEIDHGGHTKLLQLRLAACLAIFHNSPPTIVTTQHWQQARDLLATSRQIKEATNETTVKDARAQQELAAVRKGHIKAIEKETANTITQNAIERKEQTATELYETKRSQGKTHSQALSEACAGWNLQKWAALTNTTTNKRQKMRETIQQRLQQNTSDA